MGGKNLKCKRNGGFILKIIQIIGKYNGDSWWEIERNIDKAKHYAGLLLKKGYMPIVPHSNSGGLYGICPESFFYEGYKEILRRCADCVFVLDNYKTSPGSLGEIEVAEMKRIPIYYDIESVPDLLNYQKNLPGFNDVLGILK